jgi:hypothetical protein
MFHSRPARKLRAFRPRLQVLEDRTLLSTYLVDHLADDLVGSGLSGSLRYCITNAVDGDTITFGVTGTIQLTDGALPDLTHNISIDGPGPDLLTVSSGVEEGYDVHSVFVVAATVAISGLSITDGGSDLIEGGGIFNYGSLTLTNCTVSNNDAQVGGGIANDGGSVLVNNCTIANNAIGLYQTGLYGAGIANLFNGTMTIVNSTIVGNTATAEGTYLPRGGGIYNGDYGTLLVINSTITGNDAYGDPNYGQYGEGGGVFTDGGLTTIQNSTITGNRAYYAGGISNPFASPLNMRNSVVAGNSAFNGPDLDGRLTSSGYNLIGNIQGGSGFDDTDLLNVNPLLGPLQDNGGPTMTMALLPGSPALNAGDLAQLGVPDQRGVVRSGGVNIGAYQASATAFLLTALNPVTSGVPFDVTVTAVDPFGQVALGYTGTVTFSTSDPDPSVVLPADYTFTASDQGAHTFSGGFTLITPGDQTITATDTADGFSASAVVTVQGGGAPAPRRPTVGVWADDYFMTGFDLNSITGGLHP